MAKEEKQRNNSLKELQLSNVRKKKKAMLGKKELNTNALNRSEAQVLLTHNKWTRLHFSK